MKQEIKLKDIEKYQNQFSNVQDENISLKHKFDELHQDFQNLNNNYRNEVNMRKEYFGKLQDLEGNIRVFCRLRPFLPHEDPHKNTEFITIVDDINIKCICDGKERMYQFDKCFTNNSNQQEVFDECFNLVKFSVDGFNVCIFAYGQTGSGKTHTMHGQEHKVDYEQDN